MDGAFCFYRPFREQRLFRLRDEDKDFDLTEFVKLTQDVDRRLKEKTR